MLSRQRLLVGGLALAAAACTSVRAVAQHIIPADAGSLELRGATTIPFTLSAKHIYLAASIGSERYAFLFDTGGTASLVPEVQRALQFPVTGQAQLHGIGDDVRDVDLVRVPELRLGSALLRNGTFVVFEPTFPLANPLPGLRFGGILGREFFLRVPTRIDYARGRLTLIAASDFRPDPEAAALPLALREGVFPSVEASIDGRAGSFDLDVGASAAVTLTEHFAATSGIEGAFPRVAEVVIGYGAGGMLRGIAGRATTITIGPYVLRHPVVTVAHAKGGLFARTDLAGSVGEGVLHRFTLTLDAPNARAYLQPNARFGEPFIFNRAGLFSNRLGGSERVAFVSRGSPASEAGVETGDVVVAVDGRAAASFSAERLAASWEQSPGTRVVLALRRGERSIRAAVVLRDLI